MYGFVVIRESSVPRFHYNRRLYCDFNHLINRALLLAYFWPVVLHDLHWCACICNHTFFSLYLCSLQAFLLSALYLPLGSYGVGVCVVKARGMLT